MSRLINVSDSVYEQLTRIKRAKGQSYSEAIAGMLQKGGTPGKTIGWEEILAKIKARDAKFKGKKEKIDHDLIAHGVSFDHS